jgi:small subunit ribosomal protein S13
MLEIQRINIPDKKKILLSLTYIHGIGLATSHKLLTKVGIDINKKTKDLNSYEIHKLRTIIYYLIIEMDLKKRSNLTLKKLIDLKSYRSSRLLLNLPVRGQRTRTNAKTRRKLGISSSISNISLKIRKKK